MTQREHSPQQIKQDAKSAARNASPWIEPLGRLGYAAKGVVYATVGILAFQTALGNGGETTDSSGALQRIAAAPFGKLLLGVVALGLTGYGIWRIVQGLLDADNKGSDAKGRLARAGYAISGFINLGLAFTAVRIITQGEQGDSQQSMTASLLRQTWGPILIGAIGLIVLGVGGYFIYKGYAATFRKHLRLQDMSATEETWAVRAGRLGYAARGIVFAIAGGLVVLAAVRLDPEQASGIDQALAALARQPFGLWLLGTVALGLIAYAVFCFVEARYRQMLLH